MVGLEGKDSSMVGGTVPTVSSKQPEADGNLTWRDLEQIQLQKQFRFLENMHKNEEGKRETQPGTGKALKSP